MTDSKRERERERDGVRQMGGKNEARDAVEKENEGGRRGEGKRKVKEE